MQPKHQVQKLDEATECEKQVIVKFERNKTDNECLDGYNEGEERQLSDVKTVVMKRRSGNSDRLC